MEREILILKNQSETIRLDIKEIVAIICEDYCTTFYYSEKIKRFSCCKSLNQTEKLLENVENWLRINRKTIIFTQKVISLNRVSRTVMLQGNIEQQVSIRKLPILNKMLEIN